MISRMRKMKRFKIGTLDGNTKKVLRNASNSLVVKGGSLFVALFTTPAYMRYFHDYSVLGIWFTILSVLSWIMYFDMGIGNGLRNKLVEVIVAKDIHGQRKYISSAYIFLSSISAVFALFLLFSVRYINWNSFFNISSSRINSKTLMIAVQLVFVCILLQLILRLISSILYALQKAFIPNLLALITNSLMLVYVLVSNKLGCNNNIIQLAIAYIICVNLPLLLATIIVFSTSLKKARPSIKYFSKKCAYETFVIGSTFLILQFAAMIINETPIFLITRFVGAESVVQYNAYYKLYAQVYTLFNIITIPIWSAVTQSIVENNYVWIKNTVRHLRQLAMVVFVIPFALIPVMQIFMNLWLRDQTFQVNTFTMLVFSVDSGVMLIYTLTAPICNGLSELKVQMKLMCMAAILIIPLSYIGTHIYNNFTSVVIAHCISLLPYCIGQSIWLNRYLEEHIRNAT